MISIIIPVYNAEKFLEKCLNSLLNQTFKDIEFIMVDDGSTDSSAEICRAFCEKDKRFKYFYQENSGVSAARNKGIANANGNFLGFCDGDDWIEPDLYEFLYGLITENNASIAVCGMYVDIDGESFPKDADNGVIIADSQKALELTLTDNTYGGFLFNKLFNVSQLGKFFLDEEIFLYEDLLLVCSLYSKRNDIVFRNIPKYHYVQHSASAIHGPFKEIYWSGLISYKRIVEIAEQKSNNLANLAKRNFIDNALDLADKLVRAEKLNKENYKKIKNFLRPYKKQNKMLKFRRRVAFKIFWFSRKLFILGRKIRNR